MPRHDEGSLAKGQRFAIDRAIRTAMFVLVYLSAAVAEIAGCFAFWAWLRLGRSAWWALPGTGSLIAFDGLLTLVESEAAGRAFAAYGGIYIATSLLWMWWVEGERPDLRDCCGAALCLGGAAIILSGRPG